MKRYRYKIRGQLRMIYGGNWIENGNVRYACGWYAKGPARKRNLIWAYMATYVLELPGEETV